MKKILLIISLLLVVFSISSFSMFGCKPATTLEDEVVSEEKANIIEESEIVEEDVVAEEEQTYILVSVLSAHPWWTPIYKGGEDAALELGVKFEHTGPTADDALAQADQVMNIISKGPSGLLVAAWDEESMTTAVDAAWEAGIPTICLDADAPNSNRLCFFPLDPPGEAYGKEIAKLLNNKGKIGVLTVPIQNNLVKKFDEMVAYLEKNAPDIEIVAVEDNQADDQINADKTKAIIQAHPDIDGLVVLNATGSGMGVALREMDKIGEIKVVTDFVSDPILNAIKEGAIDSTITMPQYLAGYYGVKLLYDYVNELPKVPGSSGGVQIIPSRVVIPYAVVNAENADYFYAE